MVSINDKKSGIGVGGNGGGNSSGGGCSKLASLLQLDRLLIMAKRSLHRLAEWLLEVEMGFVWGVAGISIIAFIFAAIWFIDPALLTLVLKFKSATCVTSGSEFLVGINNCTWSSCRLGCTKDIFKCWQVTVNYTYNDSKSHTDKSVLVTPECSNNMTTRLYPNVRGCGYPPELNCELFFENYGEINKTFPCWVSTVDSKIAMTQLDLQRAKQEVLYSLIPLFIFIIFVLYAFCRLGVFSVCNPTKHCCPRANDAGVDMLALTPKKLFNYKKSLLAKKSEALSAFQKEQENAHVVTSSPSATRRKDYSSDPHPSGAPLIRRHIPATIIEDQYNEEEEEESSIIISAEQYRRKFIAKKQTPTSPPPSADQRPKAPPRRDITDPPLLIAAPEALPLAAAILPAPSLRRRSNSPTNSIEDMIREVGFSDEDIIEVIAVPRGYRYPVPHVNKTDLRYSSSSDFEQFRRQGLKQKTKHS